MIFKSINKFAWISLIILGLNGCQSPPTKPATESSGSTTKVDIVPKTSTILSHESRPDLDNSPPAPRREFRGLWVASVANIDWPSRRDLSVEKQKAEAIAILDLASKTGLNAIVLQVRPSADAIYPSELEPWSEYLTGEQGRAPKPFYDPLQFWIQEAHARGLELHAWFNPFRARGANARASLSPKHISKTMPNIVKNYGDLLWMDPGEPESARHTLAVIKDVLLRYDVDGIHIDDYFYPYPIKNAQGQELDFPDEASWQSFLIGSANSSSNLSSMTRADWRRQNVSQLVQTMYELILANKPFVKFGISPFGIGRPDRLPAGITGFSQYDKLYADVETWMQNGWFDYLAPQLYWPIDQSAQAFSVLNQYWKSQNTSNRAIWPGLNTSKIDLTDKSWQTNEIINQIQLLRNQETFGHIHFSSIPILQNRRNIATQLAEESYREPAIIPEQTWKSSEIAKLPTLRALNDQIVKISQVDPLSRWLLIRQQQQNRWHSELLFVEEKLLNLSQLGFNLNQTIWVQSLSKTGKLSPPKRLNLQTD